MKNLFETLFELPDAGGNRAIAMEGLRGFSVILVFFVHYSTLVGAWTPALSATNAVSEILFAIGNTGVDFFFLLSGYLIYGALVRKQRAYGPFIKRRIQRIYPTFLAVFAIYVILSFAIASENKIPAPWDDAAVYIVQNLLMLPGVFDIQPLITVAWSLSYELFFYFTIPFLVALFRALGFRAGARSALCIALWVLIFLFAPRHFRATMFIVGILLFELIESGAAGRLTRHFGRAAVLTVGATFLLVSAIRLDLLAARPWGAAAHGFLFAAAFFLGFVAITGRGKIAKALSFRPLRWVGNFSYSFYLIHGLTLKAIFFFLERIFPSAEHMSALWFWGLLGPAFLAAALVSSVLFLLVERPMSLDGLGLPALLARARAASRVAAS